MWVERGDGDVDAHQIALRHAAPHLTSSILDLSPTFFWQRIVDNVGAIHFWVGISKAPVMAIVIAGIGCRQGMEVEGDVESLGRRVTSAVVQAIFAIILLDALFALLYMELNI